MSIRRQTTRGTDDIISEDYKKVLKKAKVQYRAVRKFCLYKATKDSTFWCADISMITPDVLADEYWIFNEEVGKWSEQ